MERKAATPSARVACRNLCRRIDLCPQMRPLLRVLAALALFAAILLTAYFDFCSHERLASKSRLSPAGGRALPALFRAGRIRLNAPCFFHFAV